MSAWPQIDPGFPLVEPSGEERSAEAHRLETIGRLVNGVAHDFNNLLTGIMLCSDLLIAGLEEGNRLRRYAEEIRSAGSQGATLVEQLMSVGRQRSGEPCFLSWNEELAGMQDLLMRLIGENIELVTELSNEVGMVKMNPAQVQQIILNLVLNARDAMPDGGRIMLSTRRCDRKLQQNENADEVVREIEFCVSDCGCGMNAETRARLFEPHFTTKKPGQGNGVGLATVHDIVSQCGGSIQVESELGKGTRIAVRVPGFDAAGRESVGRS